MRAARTRLRLAEAEAEGEDKAESKADEDTMNYEPSSQSVRESDGDNPERGTEVPASIPPPSQTSSPPFFSAESACNILRPLSTVAAQRSLHLPTSGSLASLAARQLQEHEQQEHADGNQKREEDLATTTTTAAANPRHATIGSSEVENSMRDAQVLQSDSLMNATSTPDLASLHGMHTETDPNVSSAAVAVREFTAMLWESPAGSPSAFPTATPEAVVADTNADATKDPTRVQSILSTTYSSSSPLSSPASSSSIAGRFSDPYYDVEGEAEEEADGEMEVSHHPHQHAIPSPFAMIFPDGTSTTTPLFYQRLDGDQRDVNADQPHVQLCSESIQLFRRAVEDGEDNNTWKRRVFEYR